MVLAVRVSSPRFVGRREELTRLESLLDAGRSGTPTTALVTGDAGIGKTRLAEELSQRAEAVGVQVFTGRCVDVAEDVLPYGPLVEILDQAIRAHGVGRVLELAGPTRGDLARLAPALGIGEALPATTRASSARLYLALTALVNGLAGRAPLLVVIEDLHWVDRATRDLLALVQRGTRGRVMMLLTMRSDEVPSSHRLVRFVAELERAGSSRIHLSGLGRSDQARQIGAIVGVPPSSALVDRIYGRAEGNPFFAEELLAYGGEDDLPSGVRDLLLSRVRDVPDDAIQVAQIAALAGRRVSAGLLAAASDLADDHLENALRELVDRHLLVLEGDGFVFRHALLRDAISRTVLPGQTTRMHSRIAQVLTDRPTLGATDGYGVAARIAHHWHAAGDGPRTLTASLVAAAAAEEALAWPTALVNYDRAIALLDDVRDADALVGRPRWQILQAAAETAHLAAQPDRAAALVRAAIDDLEHTLTGPVDLELHHARLLERLGRYLWMAADGAGSLSAYEQAVELVPRDQPTRTQAAIYSGYSQILMLLGRFDESADWSRRAIAICDGLDDARSTEGHARNNLGVDLAFLGDVDAGIAHLEAARKIAEEEFDDVDDIARAIVNLHTVLLDAGRLEEAADVAVDGIGVVESLGLTRRKGVWCRCDAADALIRLGRLEHASMLIAQAVDLQPTGIDAVRTALVGGILQLQMGELEDADRFLDEARDRGRLVLDAQINGPLYASLVERRLLDEPRDALSVAEEGRRRLREGEDAAFCVPLFAAATRAAAEVAVAARAEGNDVAQKQAASQADDWCERARRAVSRDPADKPAPVAHLRSAQAEAARARGDDSSDAWGRAATSWEALGQPYQTAYCRMRQAETSLHDGDRDTARAVLSEAATIAEDLGAAGLLADVVALARRGRLGLAETEEPDGPVDEPAYQLTRRERDVLVLVAEGRTDRQIGEQLFISHRTVERHVSNILTKLNASTRTEASSIAHRERLLSAEELT